MSGKIIKLNDFKFTFGQETVYLNVYAVFKSKKSGNKYIIYSYDNSKLYSGSAFIKNNEIVVMISKSEEGNVIKDFTCKLVNGENDDNYEVISLDNVNSIQIIDEKLCDFDVDVNKLNNITIPKVEVKVEEVPLKKKGGNIATIFFVLFIIVVAAFFFFNPEVFTGKSSLYICNKSYSHDTLPASVNDSIELVFNNKSIITSIDVKSDYVFSDIDYYKEFRDKSYFYQYFKDGDTYKFDDSNYTYRLFSSINVNENYFLPSDKNGLISYYQDNGYVCKVVNDEVQ